MDHRGQVLDHKRALAAYVAWWRLAGVEWPVSDGPADWRSFGHKSAAAPSAPVANPTPSGAPAASAATAKAAPPAPRRVEPETDGLMGARALADAATDLASLEAAVHQFDACPLKRTATKTCFARGNPRARLMIIGEAPGRDEDAVGRPFVGRAGHLLDRMLGAIGLDDTHAYITNIVYWRPPGNRTPSPHEVALCRPFLERQIGLVGPEILLVLGRPAANHLLDVDEPISQLRGRWRTLAIGGRTVAVMPTLHPAYLLRSPAHKKLAWRDLLALAEKLKATP